MNHLSDFDTVTFGWELVMSSLISVRPNASKNCPNASKRRKDVCLANTLQLAVRELSQITDLSKIDPEPKYHKDMCHLQIRQETIDCSVSLGNSKSRSQQQIILATQAVHTHLTSLPPNCVPIFTDGSALKNPGPCGAAAVIYTHGLQHQPTILKRPVSKHSTSYHGELAAINLALEFISNMIPTAQPFRIENIIIHTDCMAALNTVTNSVKNNYTRLMSSIEEIIHSLDRRNIEFKICWIPGHAGIEANEIADKAAKEAAKESQKWTDKDECDCKSIKEIKTLLQKNSQSSWQRQWNSQDTGRETHELFPTVPAKITSFKETKNVKRSVETKLNRLKSGMHMLKSHRMRNNIDKKAGLLGNKSHFSHPCD